MLLSIQSSFNVYDIYHHGMCMHCAAQVVTLHHNHHEVLVVSLMSGYRSSCNRSTIGSFLLHNGEFAGCGSFTICSNPVHTVIVIYLPLHVHLGKRCVFSLLITGSFFWNTISINEVPQGNTGFVSQVSNSEWSFSQANDSSFILNTRYFKAFKIRFFSHFCSFVKCLTDRT